MKGRENPHILTLSPPIRMESKWLKPTAYMMAKYGMTLCALGIAEEMRDAGIASNTLWPRTLVATAAVQNLLGGDEAMARARKPAVYADAAYAIFNRPAREYTGQSLLCEDVLLDSGVTDLSVYDCVPGSDLGVDLWVDTPTRRDTSSRNRPTGILGVCLTPNRPSGPPAAMKLSRNALRPSRPRSSPRSTGARRCATPLSSTWRAAPAVRHWPRPVRARVSRAST